MTSKHTRNGTRFDVLDWLRGLAVAGMIVVTSPGDWNHTYAPLLHAEWNGWTLADMVFPTFLFAVGVAFGLSFPRSVATPDDRSRIFVRIARRALALVALGLLLNWIYVEAIGWGAWFPGKAGLANIRLSGVPQRIAACYGLAAIAVFATGRKTGNGKIDINGVAVTAIIAMTLIAYWALLMFIPVPGFGAGHLDPAGSLPAYIDRTVFTQPHLWPLGSAKWGEPATYDPEGILASFPATTNLLFGLLAAWQIRQAPEKALPRIAVAGVVLFIAGLALDPVFVINKRLWTSSFAVLSSGFSAMALAVFMLAAKSVLARNLLTPLTVLGGNAILAFTLSILVGMVYAFPFFGSGDHRLSPQNLANDFALHVLHDSYLASLACALTMLTALTLAIWPLHRKGIHLRL